jgi:hypothetical protein
MVMYIPKSFSVPLNHTIKTSSSLRFSIIRKPDFLNLPKNCMKKIIFLLFTFYFLISNLQSVICNLYSQPVTQEWVRTYPGPTNDLYGPFLAVDKQGNSYIAGTHVVNDTPKVLCVKYNTQGVQQWDALYIYPGEAYIRPSGLALDSSGNAYIIADQGPSYLLPTNGLIAKFNSLNGNLVWARRYIGQYGWGAFRDIKIDRLNNIYVAGWTDTSHLVIRYNTNGDSVWVRKYHPPPMGGLYPREVARACTIDDSLNIIFTGERILYYPPYGYYDSLLVVKYSPSGVLRWESVYSSGYSYIVNKGLKITADQNGSLYIGGITNISGDGVYLTLKYDRNGARQWVSIYNGPGVGDILKSIAMDRLNNAILVTGNSQLSGGTSFGVTIKYNASNGDSIWVIRYGMSNYISGFNDIVLDSSGNSYVTGGSGPYNSTGDVLTIKYSLQGNQIWMITYNGPYNGGDGAYALRLDSVNNVYVMGVSESSSQIFDYIVIKYSQLVGIQHLSNDLPKVFKLDQNYPNPFNPSTRIRFSVPKKSFVQLRIYDILGRLKDLPINEYLSPSVYELKINSSNYSSGVYFYQMIADGNIIDTKKFIVLK